MEVGHCYIKYIVTFYQIFNRCEIKFSVHLGYGELWYKTGKFVSNQIRNTLNYLVDVTKTTDAHPVVDK